MKGGEGKTSEREPNGSDQSDKKNVTEGAGSDRRDAASHQERPSLADTQGQATEGSGSDRRDAASHQERPSLADTQGQATEGSAASGSTGDQTSPRGAPKVLTEEQVGTLESTTPVGPWVSGHEVTYRDGSPREYLDVTRETPGETVIRDMNNNVRAERIQFEPDDVYRAEPGATEGQATEGSAGSGSKGDQTSEREPNGSDQSDKKNVTEGAGSERRDAASSQERPSISDKQGQAPEETPARKAPEEPRPVETPAAPENLRVSTRETPSTEAVSECQAPDELPGWAAPEETPAREALEEPLAGDSTAAGREEVARPEQAQPEVTEQECLNIANRMTQQALPDSEVRQQFYQITEALHAQESGGRGGPSQVGTGAGAPASFGTGQLLFSEHADQFSRMPIEITDHIGLNRQEINSIRDSGARNQAWYDIVNGARITNGRLQDSGLSRVEADRVRDLVENDRRDQLVAEFGDRFSQNTGLNEVELGRHARIAQLPELRQEYLAERQQGYSRIEAATQVVQAHPDFLREFNGRLSEGDIRYYVETGRFRENRGGAWTAGGRTSPSMQDFERALNVGADQITTRARDLQNFEKAQRAVSQVGNFDQLDPRESARMLGQISSINHASPSACNRIFFDGGQPRFDNLQDLQRAIENLRGQMAVRVGNFNRQFDQVVPGP